MAETSRRGVLGLLGGAALGVGLPGVADASAYDSTIVVDASKGLGTFFNPGWYINHTHPNWVFSGKPTRGLLPEQTLRQLKDDFNVLWARVVVKAENFYDAAAGTYDFARNYPYIDQAASYANRLLLSFTSDNETVKTPAFWEELMRKTLLDHKVRYAKIDCVMPWIEPNLGAVGGKPDGSAMTAKEFYPFYAAGYRAVAAVNAQLKPSIPLTFGGPTTSNLPEAWVKEFLQLYAADTDSRKRLDFLSVQLYHKNRDNPRQAVAQRATLRTLLANAGLPTSIPPYVTEYGLYSGDSDTGLQNGSTAAADLAHDQLVQACGVAALGRYYLESGMNRPFHWVIHHGGNARKDMFVEGKDGVRLPFGHVMVMQGMLKSRYDDGRRVATTISPDGSSSNGIGIGAVAHVDSGQLGIMYWNYQAESGTKTHSTKLTIRNFPKDVFGGKRVRVESWLVDATHNNYNHDGATAFTRNAIFSMDPLTEFARVLPLAKNAVGFLRITPIA